MKIKYTLFFLGAFFLCQSSVHADTISGKVTEIDTADQKVTLRRDDTNENVTVHIKDRNSVINLQRGTPLTLDASKEVSGTWEAQSAESPNNVHNPNTNASTSAAY